MPIGIRLVSNLLNLPVLCRIMSVCLFSFFLPDLKANQVVDLSENFKFYDLEWNSSSSLFELNGEALPQISLLDNNNYVFRNHSDQKFLISDQLDGSYLGSEVFENNSSGPDRYLVFSPESNDTSTRNFFYYNPDSSGNFGQIEVLPFIRSELIESVTLSSEAKFGYSLGINQWSQIAIGAPGEDSFAGKVFIWEPNASLEMNLFQELSPPVELLDSNMQFGSSLHMEADWLAIGAPNDSSFSGAVFLFQRQDDREYQFISKVVDPSGADFDTFGFDLSMDSSSMAISSTQIGSAGNGKISVFDIDPNGTIVYNSSISASDGALYDEFGYDLEISGDLLVAGSPKSDNLENGTNSGVAYVFERNGSNEWIETAKLIPAELTVNDQFGISVATANGLIFVGSLRADGEGVDTGGVFVFEKIDGNWQQTASIFPPESTSDQFFSTQIEAIDDQLFVSSPGSSTHGTVFAYKMEQNASFWKLISVMDYNQTSIAAGTTTLAPIACGQGMVLVGSPEESSSVDAGGGIQAFFNPAWRIDFQIPEVAPLLEPSNIISFSLDEDSGEYLYDFNASHPFDDNLSWNLVNSDLGSLGTISIDSNEGILSFFPSLNSNGDASLQIEVNGENNQTLEFSVELSVLPTNDPPVFSGVDSSPYMLQQAMEGNSFEQVISLDDVDGDSLSLSLKAGSSLPAGLSVSSNPDEVDGHRIIGTPALGSANGEEYFDYTFTLLADDGNLVVEHDFSLRVYKNNEAPEVFFNETSITNINLELLEDFEISTWTSAMSGIDFTDPNGDDLNFTLISLPADGNVSIDRDHANDAMIISYLPQEDQFGQRSFTVRVSDLGHPEEFQLHVDLVFNVLIESVEDSPRIVSPLPPTHVNEGEEFTHTFEVVDPDPDSSVTVVVEGLPDWISLSDDNRTISGTPQFAHYNDGIPSTIFISLSDGNGPEIEQFYSLTVVPLNFPPVIVEPSSLSQVIDEDENPTEWEPITITAYDPDVNEEAGGLVWSVVEGDTNGTVTLSGEGASVTVDYRPEGNFSGVDSFMIKVSEENFPESIDTVLFTVEVNSIEDDPVFRSIPIYTQAVVGYSWEYEILVSDGDIGQSVIVDVLDDTPPWLSLIKISDDNFLIRGTPPITQDGNFSVGLRVTDDQNNSSDQQFTLEVLLENTPPLLPFESANEISILEDETWQPENLEVVDPDKQKILWTLLTEPSHGTVEFVPNLGKNINLYYVPDGNYSGSDFFSFRITDGISSDEANFSVDIIPEPDPPVFVQFPILTEMTDDEEMSEIILVADGDSMEGLTLSYENRPEWMDINDTLIENNGTIKLSGSPTHEDGGPVELLLVITDAEGLTVERNFNFTVFVHNLPPSFLQEEHTVFMTEDEPETWVAPQITVSDDQTPVEELSWSIFSQPGHGSASIDLNGQNLIYVPEDNFFGNDSFSIEVLDRGGVHSSLPKSGFITINVVVEAIDDPPYFVSSPTTDRQDSISWNDESIYHYFIEAVDPDGNFPIIRAVSDLPPWLSFETVDNTGFGVLSGLAKVSDQGRYRLSFEASDGLHSTSQNFDLVIRIDDYPPAFYSTSSNVEITKVRTFMNEDNAGNDGWSPPTNYYCLNPDGGITSQDLQWTIASNPISGANLEVSGTGQRPPVFNYLPPSNFNGYDEFFLQASDGRRTSNLLFEIYVKSIPDKPSFVLPDSSNYTIQNGVSFEIPIEARDDDSSNLSFKFFIPDGKSENWIELIESEEPNKATLTGTPPASNKNKSIPLTLSVTDDSGMFDTLDIVLTVSGTNQAPIISTGNEMTIVFSNSGIPISDNFNDLIATDEDDDPLSWEISVQPLHGSLDISFTNSQITSLVYFPNSSEITEDSFYLRVSDGTKYDEIKINALVSLDPNFTIIDGNDSLHLGQGVFFANDFTVINQNLSFEANLVSGPDWVSIEKLSEQKIRLSGTTPATLVGDYEVVFGLSFADATVTKTMSIALEDKIPPEIVLEGSNLISLALGEPFVEPGYRAIDQDGVDYSAQVVVHPNADEFVEGLNVLEYSVSDSSGNLSRAFRSVVLYEDSPISFSSVSYIKSNSIPKIAWSEGVEKIIAFDSLSQIRTTFPDQSEVLYGYEENGIGIGKFSSALDSIIWELGLSGNPLSIDVIYPYNDYYFIAGTFRNEISIAGNLYTSDQENGFYMIKTSKEGQLTWVKTFDSTNQVDSLCLAVSENGGLLLGGNFSGNIFLQNDEKLTSHDDSLDFFLLKFNELGNLQKFTSFGETGDNLLRDLTFDQNNEVFLLTNTKKPAQEIYGLLLKLNEELDIVSFVSFESDDPSTCQNLLVSEDEIFISVNFENRLLMRKQGENIQTTQNELLSEFQGKAAVLMKMNSAYEIDWKHELQADNGVEFIDLQISPTNDLIGLVSHDGNLSDLQSQDGSGGNLDLTLLKFQNQNGSSIWTKKIAGEGNEANASMVVNQYGSVNLILKSDQGLVLDATAFDATAEDEFLVVDFLGAMPIEFNPMDDLNLQSGEFFTAEINLINQSSANFALLEAPDFVSIYQHPNGSATLAGKAPSFATTGSIKIRAYDFDGSFSDLSVGYTVENSNQPDYRKSLPEFESSLPILSDGKIIDMLSPNGRDIIIAGNALGTFTFDGQEFSTAGKQSCFILFANSSFDLVNSLQLQSSQEVFITGTALDTNGNFLCVGSFKDSITLEGNRYFSNGGYDIFLMEVSENGSVLSFNTFGGTSDEFSSKLRLVDDQVSFSGQFWGTFPLPNSDSSVSSGSQDGFIAIFERDNLAEIIDFLKIGGQSFDEITDHHIQPEGIITIAGNFLDAMEWGSDIVYAKNFKASFVGNFDREGEAQSISVFDSEANPKIKRLLYDEKNQFYVLSGEFDGTIKVNNLSLDPVAGLDIFLVVLDADLKVIALKSVGGSGTDKITDLEFDSSGDVLLSGTFSDSIQLGDELISSNEKASSFICKLSLPTLDFEDKFVLMADSDNRIDEIKPIHGNWIIYGSQVDDNEGQVIMQIGTLGFASNKPYVLDSLPKVVSSDLFFTSEFSSGPWIEGENSFTIRSQLPPWLEFQMQSDGTGTISGQPPESEFSVVHELIIEVNSTNDESLLIEHNLTVLGENNLPPQVFLEDLYTFKQFESIRISVRGVDPEDQKIIMQPDLPDWLSWTTDGENKILIQGYPGVGDSGIHNFSIFSQDESGLISFTSSSILIEPNLGSDSSSESEGMPESWSEEWIGTYALARNGWAYHTVWGWVWLQPSEQMADLWFFRKDMGWFWTDTQYWDGTNQSGFIFSDALQDWIFLTNSPNGNTLYFDYIDGTWNYF